MALGQLAFSAEIRYGSFSAPYAVIKLSMPA
jgi:hypothetical protein